MPEPVASYMIVSNLDHQLRPQGLPLGRSLGAPATGSTRRIPSEARRRDKFLKPCSQRGFVLVGYGGREADMMQQPGIIVEAEQQRSHEMRRCLRSESRRPRSLPSAGI